MEIKEKNITLLKKRDLLLKQLQEVETEISNNSNEELLPTSDLKCILDAAFSSVDGLAFFITDKAHHVIFSNDAMTRYLTDHGLPSEIIGREISEVLPFIDTWLDEIYEKAKNNKVPVLEEKLIRLGDINYLVNFDIRPVVIGGSARYFVTNIHNKTGILESEKHARLLATILDHSDDVSTIKDLDLRIIGANKSLVKSVGKTDIHEVLGKTDMELFGDHEHVRQYMKDDRAAQKLNPGEYIEREEFFIFHDGRIIDTLVRKFPIFDKDGKLIGTANISRDISELKRVEKELRASEEKYRRLVENQGEGIGIIDRFGVFTFSNRAAENIFGVKNGSLRGRSIRDFFLDGDNEIVDDLLHQDNQQKHHSYEIEIYSRNEEKKYLLITTTSFLNEHDIPEGTFIIFRDITDRRLAEKALLESEKELLDLNATKDKFFSIIAHDLKNPFGSIMGFTELIQRKASQNDIEKVKHYAKIIFSASKHGFELLENLLDWSRSQNGSLRYLPGRVSLDELIAHNIEVTGEIANNKNITLTRELAQDISVYCDEDMVNTVLRNLITNAIKFSNRGSEIIISAEKHDDNQGRIVVQDHGIGIMPEDAEKLFKIECSESEKGTEGEEGTGLGLILCKEFVEKNNGNIWVESEPEKGSRFIFTLPLYTENS